MTIKLSEAEYVFNRKINGYSPSMYMTWEAWLHHLRINNFEIVEG